MALFTSFVSMASWWTTRPTGLDNLMCRSSTYGLCGWRDGQKIKTQYTSWEWSHKGLTSPSTVMLSVPICCATLIASRNSSVGQEKTNKQISTCPHSWQLWQPLFILCSYIPFIPCHYEINTGVRSGQYRSTKSCSITCIMWLNWHCIQTRMTWLKAEHVIMWRSCDCMVSWVQSCHCQA